MRLRPLPWRALGALQTKIPRTPPPELPSPAWSADMTIVLALASAIVYGVADYCGGRATRSNPAPAVALVGQVVGLGLVVAVLVAARTPVLDSRSFAWGAAGGASGAVGLSAFYFALANGTMSVVAPLTAVVGAALPVGVGVATGERPSPLAYLGIAIAIVAVALVSGVVDRAGRAATSARPVVLVAAVTAGVGFGGLFVGLDRTADDSGMWPLLAARCGSIPLLLVLLVVGATAGRRGGPSIGWVRRGTAVAVVAGVLDMTANLLYLEATRTGLLSLVAVISSLYPASTVALAALVDRERVGRPQLAGMGLAAAALVCITLGRA